MYEIENGTLEKLLHAQEYAKAIEIMLDASPEGYDERFYYYVLGECYRELWQPEAARLMLHHAEELNQNSATAAYAHGVVLELLSRYDEAIAAFQRVIRIDKGNISSYQKIGRLYAQKGEFEHAFLWLDSAFSQLHSFENRESETHDTIASRLEQRGIIFDYQRQERRKDKLAGALLRHLMGVCYYETGNFSKAKAWFTSALRALPEGYTLPEATIYLQGIRNGKGLTQISI